MARSATVLPAAALLAALASGPGAQAAESVRYAFDFAGSIAGLRVMRANVDATLEATSYQGSVMFQSAGLVGFFKTARVEGHGSGARAAEGFAPAAYRHREVNGRKVRTVDLSHEADDVVVVATPPFGSLGDPAPTAEQRREALDPLAMVLEVAFQGGEAPCARTVPVFDSKLRYDLEFEPDGAVENLRTRGYRGPALRCRVYYRPIAGYDPEDLAEDEVYATPIRLWLAEVTPGVTAPVLVRARFGPDILPFGVKLELTDIEATEES